jgi:ATP-dependent Lhr-like helicase
MSSSSGCRDRHCSSAPSAKWRSSAGWSSASIRAKKKTGRQVTFSTDLIYDVLRKYEPDHLLLNAAWADARARMTDVGRLGHLLDTAADTMLHIDLPRVSPMAVPVLIMIGRENVAQGMTEDALLMEAEDIAAEAMRLD